MYIRRRIIKTHKVDQNKGEQVRWARMRREYSFTLKGHGRLHGQDDKEGFKRHREGDSIPGKGTQ